MRGQRRVSQVSSIQAPTGGINDLDPLATMGPEFCITMNNWVPGTGALSSREGYSEWVTGLPGTVDTLLPFYRQDGSQSLYAATNSGIYDATLSTAMPINVKPITYGNVSFTQYSNVAGQYLVVCNGVDPAILYNGTTWKDFTNVTTPTNPGEISGVDPSTLSGVHSYKGRLWFIQEESLTAWYLGADSVGGVAKPFYFGSVFNRGGYLAYLSTWSFDSGSGLDDKFVVQTSAGEVAIYTGNDPSDANSWALEAVFFVSSPVGHNPSVDMGGDVILLTRAGLAPLSTMVKGTLNTAMSEAVISRRISRTINALVNSASFQNDWEIHNVPLLQSLVVMVPATSERPAAQYIMNTLTGAWGKLDMPAHSGGIYNKKFYFGGTDGKIYSYGGQYDGVKLDGSGGLPVECSFMTAYNYFGDPTTLKHYKMVRPIFQSNKLPAYLAQINVDYAITALAGNPPSNPIDTDAPLWGLAIWDAAFWSSQATVYRPWVGVVGMGFCAALLFKVSVTDPTYFTACEYVYEPGAAV